MITFKSKRELFSFVVGDKERVPDFYVKHKYKGYGIHDSECIIKIWTKQKYTVVLLIDIGVGTSVINSAEQLISDLWKMCLGHVGIKREDCLFLETSLERGEYEADEIEPVWSKFSVLHGPVEYKRSELSETTIYECKKVNFKPFGKLP